MRNLISYGFLAPPNVLIVLCIAGALLSLVWRRVGIIVVLVSSFSLYASATPVPPTPPAPPARAGTARQPDRCDSARLPACRRGSGRCGAPAMLQPAPASAARHT